MRRLTKRERNLIIGVLAFAIIGLFVIIIIFLLKRRLRDEKNQKCSSDIDDAKVTKIMVDSAKDKGRVRRKSLEHEEYLMESIDEPIY